MKTDQHIIYKIRRDFANMQSREDLLQLLNEAKPHLFGRKAVPFKMKQLTWYSNPNLGGRRYKKFKIKKKSGEERSINAPVKGLKVLQQTLAFILQAVYEPHKAVTGFVRNKSVVDNAKIHVGSNYIYNIDLKDFFTSIDQARVWKTLQLKPYNLSLNKIAGPHSSIINDIKGEMTTSAKLKDNPERIDQQDEKTAIPFSKLEVGNSKNEIKQPIQVRLNPKGTGLILRATGTPFKKENHSGRLKLASIIAAICCVEMEVERKNQKNEWEIVKRNVLPQGAPTSPVISNIVCQRLDYLLTGVANRFGLRYSRYADDITFSSMHNVYQTDSAFLKEIQRIINEQGFTIKESKTRLQKRGFNQEVTGLTVNEKVNVNKQYIKEIRKWLYYWERYGYDKASGFFLQQFISDKGNLKKGKTDMTMVLAGKLNYLKMVKGAENELYQKLKARFEITSGKVASVSKNLIEVEEAKASNSPLMKLLDGLTERPNVHSKLKNSDVSTEAKSYEKPIPVFHKPKLLVALLKNFSANDSSLKYTTHSWDAGRDVNMFKDLSEFLSIAKTQYNEFSFVLKGLSENLNGKIYNFLFNKKIGKTGWGDINPKKRIYFGWSSPELLEACKNDISLNPEDFILPEKYQIQRYGKTLQKFKHIIDVFKNEIEIRDENSALLNLILQKHDQYLISFSAPYVTNLENKTFYTDIQWLGKALDIIFEGIQKYPQHPIVEYAVTESNNDRLILTILHRNSFKNGLSIHDDKLSLKCGDFSTIKDKLRNLCDWCIESEFTEGAYRINYLVSDNEIPAYEKIMSAEGFKHILTFYK